MKTLTYQMALLLSVVSVAQNAPGEPVTTGKSAARAESAVKTAAKDKRDEDTTEGPSIQKVPQPAAVSSIDPESLVNFQFYPPQVKHLVREALALTKLNLRYSFGGSDPKEGGMDCSGTIVRLLNKVGLRGVPRQSDEICAWVQNGSLLHRTPTAQSLAHPEFAALAPGDLLFWSGTYETGVRKIPVTHVMLYLGKQKKGGHVAFGASDGRYFQGERRSGVSVFDLSVPKTEAKATFYGYGLIPGVGRVVVPSPPVVVATTPKVIESTVVAPTKIEEEPESIRPAIVVKPPTVAKTEAVEKAKPPVAKKKIPAKATAKTSPQRKASAKRPAPDPTPQEQLGAAAKKVVDSVKNVFTR
jgi:cell wall-associated NlpC family hydrolase